MSGTVPSDGELKLVERFLKIRERVDDKRYARYPYNRPPNSVEEMTRRLAPYVKEMR